TQAADGRAGRRRERRPPALRWVVAAIAAGSPTRAHEPGLVGEDHRLGAVADVALGEHVAHVGLDGLLGEEESLGDLLVGQALGDQHEHLFLARGELLDRRRLGAGFGAHLEVGLDEATGEGRGEERLTSIWSWAPSRAENPSRTMAWSSTTSTLITPPPPWARSTLRSPAHRREGHAGAEQQERKAHGDEQGGARHGESALIVVLDDVVALGAVLLDDVVALGPVLLSDVVALGPVVLDAVVDAV